MTSEDLWYERLRPRAASEAALIVNAFRDQHRIEIGGVPDAAEQDDSVIPGGIGFMYAEGRLLVREQYLGQVQEILRRYGARNVGVSRVVEDVVLLTINANRDNGAPESDKGSAESNDRHPEGGNGSTGGDGGIAQGNGEIPVGEQPSALFLLDRIDEELGVGIATPDHVLTAAEMAGCPATEPEEFYGPREPYPPVCRDDGGEGVRIFIADTGLLENAAQDFPWLHHVKGETDRRVEEPGNEIKPYAGHGTFVAGVVRCMAPAATIRVANIFNTAGSALESYFVPRLNAAFGFGAEILHLTASCMTRKNVQLIALEAWLKLLRPYKGLVCIAPAGNHHTRRPSWPGAFPDVLSVGALSTDWRSRAYFSDYGSHVDVYAPGQNIINAYASGTYTCQIAPYIGEKRTFHGLAQWSGTSFSTPVVTGLIAARMARCGENGREAAAALLAKARTQRIPGVGPVLLPGCDKDDGCGDGDRGRCRGRCGDGDCRCGGDGCRCGGCEGGRPVRRH